MTYVFRVKEFVLEPITLASGRVIERGDPIWLTPEEITEIENEHPGAIYPADNRAAMFWEEFLGKRI